MAQHRTKEEWTELLAAYKHRSGTQVDFCKENGISVAALGYHLRRSACTKAKQGAEIIELKPPGVDATTSMSLDLLELNCHHPDIGSIMIRTPVKSLTEVITQLKVQAS